MAAKKKSPAKKKPAPKKTTAKKSAPRKAAPKKAAPKKSSPAKKAAPAKKRAPARKAAPTRKGSPTRRPARTSKRPAPGRKAVAKKATGKLRALPEAAEALALARSIAKVAAEKKAEDVLIVDVRARAASVGYDYVVLASGESDRQLSAIHEGVDELLKPQGKRAASVEASPDWVCVNYDEGVVAHFFTPDKRSMMDLEGMWKDAPRVSP